MQAVVLGADGFSRGVNSGVVVIDHTTNAPTVVRDVGAAEKARGAHLLDAPLDGGGEGALDGRLMLFVGGDEGVLRYTQPGRWKGSRTSVEAIGVYCEITVRLHASVTTAAVLRAPGSCLVRHASMYS